MARRRLPFGTGRHHVVALTLVSGLACATGCDSDDAGQGSLRVTIYGESFVEDRVPAEDVVDGWEVVFSKFLVGVHDVEASGVGLADSFVFDLRLPSGGNGHELGTMTVPAGTVEHLSYRIAPAAAGADGNASAADVDAMVDAGASLWVAGVAQRGEETMAFDWRFATDTRYVDCQTEQPVSEGGEATSQITVHSDHLLYDDLESEEPNVAFDLIAGADTDGDGTITVDELRATDITGQARYQVGSRDIAELWSFIEAQTGTVGHIDGEGHCDTQ